MAEEEEFTFCQVGPPVDDIGAQRITSDIREIHIEDENSNLEDGVSNQNGANVLRASTSSQKQETVGSLKFTVTDANQQAKQGGQEITAASNKVSQQAKAPVKKPAPRAKVPFEKGYSQMDWLKLTRTHPDLAGLKGQSNKRLISLAEVKQNQSGDSMWTVLKGHVYNIAPYMKFHPGGVDMLMKAVGKDCTSLFNKYHAWVNAEFLLEKCLVGVLDEQR